MALESQPVPESGQQTGESGAADQSQQEEPAPEKISPALNQIEAAIRDLIAQQRTAQGQGPEDHEISDLEAQEGMAFWAETMFWATLAAVIVTFSWAGLAHAQENIRPVVEGQPVPESGQDAGKGGAEDKSQEKKPAPEQLVPALDKIEAAIRDLIAHERAAQSQPPENHEVRDLDAQDFLG